MYNRNKLLLWSGVLIAAFLLGFIPQYGQVRSLRGELRATQARVSALEWQLELAKLRDLAGSVYVETNRANYSVARQHSTQFFDHAAALHREAAESPTRLFLESLLQQRDDITAGLTRGDGSVREPVENLYMQVHERTGNGG